MVSVGGIVEAVVLIGGGVIGACWCPSTMVTDEAGPDCPLDGCDTNVVPRESGDVGDRVDVFSISLKVVPSISIVRSMLGLYTGSSNLMVLERSWRASGALSGFSSE